MAARYKNILLFNVGAGLTVVEPHGLIGSGGLALKPDRIEPDVGGTGLVLSADDTNITATNPTGLPITVNVLAEFWHSIERAFGDVAITHLTPDPFVAGQGAADVDLVVTDGVTIQGDGTIFNPVEIKAVQHDGTLTGAGTVASPLSAVGGGGGATGPANALGFFDTAPPLTAPLIGNVKLIAGALDPQARPQIHDFRVNPVNMRGSIWRNGSWEEDGDPTSQVGEGFVTYGANALGNGPDGSQGGYGFITPYSFGRYQIIPGVNGGNTFLTCGFEDGSVNAPFGYNAFLVVDNANLVQFKVDRATGFVTVGDGVGAAPFNVLDGANQWLQVGSADAYARRQIWFTEPSSVLRLGADALDGDVFSADSEGIVVYQPSANYLARVKANRFGLTRATDSSLYYFRVDDTQLFYRADPPGGAVWFHIDRATGAIAVSEGANGMAGVIALGALGTVTIPNTRVTANTRFLLTAQDGGPAPTGVISQTARVPGVSFTITSSVPADVGVQVYYQLWEPS